MTGKKGNHLFLADDDADDREFIKIALKKSGFTGHITEFANGQILWDYLKTHPLDFPDLILLDLNMPVKNGYETLKELKSESKYQSIPVVVLTSSTLATDEQICLRLGCAHFLHKPLSLEGYREVASFVKNVI